MSDDYKNIMAIYPAKAVMNKIGQKKKRNSRLDFKN